MTSVLLMPSAMGACFYLFQAHNLQTIIPFPEANMKLQPSTLASPRPQGGQYELPFVHLKADVCPKCSQVHYSVNQALDCRNSPREQA